MSIRLPASLLAAALVVLAAAPIASAETFLVQMTSVDFRPQFVPAELDIRVGDTVRWVNVDPGRIDHSTCSGAGSTDPFLGDLWDSGPLATDAWFEYTFEEAGTFEYFSVLYEFENMFGVIRAGDGTTDVPGGTRESTWARIKSQFSEVLPRD